MPEDIYYLYYIRLYYQSRVGCRTPECCLWQS